MNHVKMFGLAKFKEAVIKFTKKDINKLEMQIINMIEGKKALAEDAKINEAVAKAKKRLI